jgi:pentatricopeptide repeat protein
LLKRYWIRWCRSRFLAMHVPPRDAATSGAGGLPSVTRILEEPQGNTKFSHSIFNAGVSALASVGDVEGAIQVLSSALEAGVTPNSDTTPISFKHWVVEGRQLRCRSFYSQCQGIRMLFTILERCTVVKSMSIPWFPWTRLIFLPR